MVSALRLRLTGIIQPKCLAAGMHGTEDAPVAKMGLDSLRLATVRALLAPSGGAPSISETKSYMTMQEHRSSRSPQRACA